MNKKQLHKEIIEMIKGMENNTFLLPDSWTDLVQMASHPFSYKTYVGGRGNNRYINIEVYLSEKKFDGRAFTINIRKEIVSVDGDNLFGKRLSPVDVHKIIKDIYVEKHSFENHNEGERAIREKMTSLRKSIKSAKDSLAKLEEQLSDLKKI